MTGLQQAVQLFQAGRFADAENLLRGLLKSSPKHPGALFLQGNCFAQRGAWGDAVSAFENAIAFSPNFLDARLDLARLYTQMGRTEDAETCLRGAIAGAPGSAIAHTALGLMLFKASRLAEAEGAFREAAHLEPTQPLAHKNLGDAIWSQGRQMEAIDHHAEAVQYWQGSPNDEFFSHVWQVLTTMGQQARALLIAQKWLQLNPNDAVALHCAAASRGDTPSRASDGYVTEMFDQFAQSFDEQLAAVDYQGPALVTEALRRVNPQCAAAGLDAGCGTGLCAPLLRPLASRLIGVDLSPKMLQLARERGGHDELVEQELTSYLQAHPNCFDWIVSADTFLYFGNLKALVQAAMQTLFPGGHLIFTVERATTPSPFALLPEGRYCHSPGYITAVLAEAGFELLFLEARPIRNENSRTITALVATARKPTVSACGVA
ncbi:MAG TPA: tetratricopeptide repeat protein [Polyangiaceae bacterium]|nr:tetratricopeptide repeat protein [Polyangiaceae bacterium]